jgi:hypothetical protein
MNSRQRIHWDSWHQERAHQAKLLAKLQKIQTLQALLEVWESHPNPDHAYIIQLRAKLRSVVNQYEAMRP